MFKKSAQYLISQLQLIPHPEGGYFRETYRSDLTIPCTFANAGFPQDRSVSTAIYFLLANSQCSAFHRIQSDELWHFHLGDSLLIHVIAADGELHALRLGPHLELGDALQVRVPARHWFAAEVIDKESFGLCTCTVAPGFDFADFELADVVALSRGYPQHADLIHRMAAREPSGD